MFKFLHNLPETKRIVAGWCGLYGWFYGLFLLNVSPFWEYIIRGIGGVCFAAIGVFVGLLTTDAYKLHIKDKIFKSKKHGSIKDEEADSKAA